VCLEFAIARSPISSTDAAVRSGAAKLLAAAMGATLNATTARVALGNDAMMQLM